jgi:hypothetical protein
MASKNIDLIQFSFNIQNLVFSAPFQTDPEAHPAFCIMGTGSFSGVKQPRRDADPSPPSGTKVKNRVELNLYSP